MKPHRAFTASGPAALHCDALLKGSTSPADMVDELGRTGARLVRALPAALAPLCSGKPPHVRALPVEQLDEAALGARIGSLAGNSLMNCAEVPLLASVEASAVFAQLDRSFGGTGEIGSEVPTSFPTSARMLLARLEARLANELGAVLGKPVSPKRSDPDYATLEAFAARDMLAILPLEVAPADARPWEITLATPVALLGKLLGKAPARTGCAASGLASPLDTPFADMPLPLEARLVDMRLRLSSLAELAPGFVLPVAVARAVPLTIGSTTIAHGTLGELDDRVALQVTCSNIGKDSA